MNTACFVNMRNLIFRRAATCRHLSHRNLPAHQARQQQVARGAEFLVLPLQDFALVNQRFNKFAEAALDAWRRNKNLRACQYPCVGVWLGRAADS